MLESRLRYPAQFGDDLALAVSTLAAPARAPILAKENASSA